MSRASRSPLRRMQRVCRKKVAYDSQEQCAHAGAKAWLHNRLYLVPYTCEICGKYHMTKKGARAEIAPVIAAAMVMAQAKRADGGDREDR